MASEYWEMGEVASNDLISEAVKRLGGGAESLADEAESLLNVKGLQDLDTWREDDLDTVKLAIVHEMNLLAELNIHPMFGMKSSQSMGSMTESFVEGAKPISVRSTMLLARVPSWPGLDTETEQEEWIILTGVHGNGYRIPNSGEYSQYRCIE